MKNLIKDDKRPGLLYRRWCVSSAKAVFVLIHGLGAHSARWDFLAEFLVKTGISSYAIELRGFGETEGLKGHVDSFNVYFEDIKRLSEIAREENPGKKIFIVGESMGGLIAFQMAVLKPNLFDAAICISPAFLSRLKFSFLAYVDMLSSALYNPRKQFNMPFDAGMCTRDTVYQQVMDGDAREHRFASARLLGDTLLLQMKSMILKNKIKKPVLFLLAGKDMLVDPEMSKRIFKGLKTKDKKIILYPGMHHALSIDMEREKVFEDILEWINGKI